MKKPVLTGRVAEDGAREYQIPGRRRTVFARCQYPVWPGMIDRCGRPAAPICDEHGVIAFRCDDHPF